MKYMRFEASFTDDNGNKIDGFWWIARYLYNNDKLYHPKGPYDDHERVYEILKWLGDNLVVPSKFDRSSNSRKETRGLSWFKATASEHIKYMRELAEILKRHGIIVNVVSSSQPGYIVFEDDFQVVAEPFKAR